MAGAGKAARPGVTALPLVPARSEAPALPGGSQARPRPLLHTRLHARHPRPARPRPLAGRSASTPARQAVIMRLSSACPAGYAAWLAGGDDFVNHPGPARRPAPRRRGDQPLASPGRTTLESAEGCGSRRVDPLTVVMRSRRSFARRRRRAALSHLSDSRRKVSVAAGTHSCSRRLRASRRGVGGASRGDQWRE
jgi:hypothetical protein